MKAIKIWIFIFLLSIPAVNVHAWTIPDTGQTKCFNNTVEIACPRPGEAFYGQDGSYTIDLPSYTKLDASGNALTDDATSWLMIRDNLTGLIWENKTNDGTIRDGSKTFTWCDMNTATNGGNQGTCGTGTGSASTDTEAFIKALNDAQFGGFSDWRMPNLKELESIVDMGRTNPAVNTAWFPNTVSSYYWSSTTYADYHGNAWLVEFSIGDAPFSNKPSAYAVRAVRGGQSVSLDHLVVNGDGTVTDTDTGLMWQQGTETSTITWEAALTYAEGLSLAGYNDWRLPTLTELQSIVDYSHFNPAIDTALFPGTLGTLMSNYWSSTTNTNSVNDAGCVSFYQGYVFYSNKPSANVVRAVRGGQSRLLDHLVLSEPRRTARWNIGQEKTITWETAAISGTVKISLSRQGGKAGTFTETIADGAPNNGSYAWTVTGPTSVNCALRIEPLSDVSKDTTQGLFSIEGTLTVSKSGTGSGTVISNPTGIDCGSTCSASFNSGSVTLTATPDTDASFTGWSGEECSGTGICTVTMDAVKSVTATFVPSRKLSVQKAGSGTGTVTSSPPSGISPDINCGSVCTADYIINTALTLTAVPDTGYAFAGWSGDCTGAGFCTVTMDADKNVTATFDDLTPPGAPVVSGMALTNNTKPTWSWISGGDGSGTFRYKLDSNDLTSGATETTMASYTPATALSDGSHKLYVQERDTAGNWSTSGSFTITVDNTVPVVNSGGNQTKNGIFTQTATGTDTNTMTYAWSKQAGPGTVTFGTATALSTTITASLEGTYTIRFTATDVAGNSSFSDMTLLWDTTPPVAVIGTFSATVTKSGPVTYAVTYTGANAVTLAAADVTLNKTGTANGTIAVSGTDNSTRTVTISGITGDGTLGISIAAGTASDVAGNQAIASEPSSIFTVDNTAPVTTASPVSGVIGKGQAVTLTQSETATIYYTLDNSTPDMNSAVYIGPIILAADATVKFFARDLVGNVEEFVRSTTYRIMWPGDINLSGDVDLADAILAIQILSGMTPAEAVYKEADVNADGKIGLTDVIYILQRAAEMR